jgi:hypothetical protein
MSENERDLLGGIVGQRARRRILPRDAAGDEDVADTDGQRDGLFTVAHSGQVDCATSFPHLYAPRVV